MFYKRDSNNGFWLTGYVVNLPNGVALSSENIINDEGWGWFDSPPKEYLDWKQEQEILMITPII